MSAVKPISDPTAGVKPSKDFPYWLPNIDHRITPKVRCDLEEYSGIRPADIPAHIYAIREKAWAICPYPCTGLGAFLSPNISQHPAYSTILSRLKSGSKFLDIGCYMGQDLRRLALDGIPQDQLFGSDIVDHWHLGYEYFQDTDRFHAHYIESDLLYPIEKLKDLHGQIDIISIVHVLHEWYWDTQILACKELVKLSKPGSLVVGYTGGTSDIAKRTQENKERDSRLHNIATFQRMWHVVGQETGTLWSTEAAIVPWSELAYRDEEVACFGSDFALLRFQVTRNS